MYSGGSLFDCSVVDAANVGWRHQSNLRDKTRGKKFISHNHNTG